jgi:hypothetical protein
MRKLPLLLMLLLSCDEPYFSDCYVCKTTETKEYCDRIEQIVTTDPIRCGWSAEEIQQLEQKHTFTITEKCFTLTQELKCRKK